MSRTTPQSGHPCDDAAPASQSGPIDSATLERLFREHNEALVRFLMTRLRSSHEAREVAQEAYVRLLSLHEPGAVSYLRAFLYKTAANLATDRIRRSGVHARASDTPLFHDFIDALSPERHLSGEQELRRIERLVQELPSKCRQAFVLNRFYGMEFADIARTMGLKERMVRTYVVRALLYCRSRLDLEDGKAPAKDADHDG